MEDTPINVDTILEQARNWTFDGDFRILQWMNKISQNLESKATKTTENLDRLNNNVKSTHVALDNVANSLTALQYGNQFVECRVQDDDETSAGGGNEGMVANGIAESPTPTPKEVLAAFLHNNLKVLRNCHEKYSIDLDDSDEEDEKSKTTYIFKPLNPYNDKPLPHIVGSKEWSEKWHVGLGYDDQDNSYSGDEMSDAYSESSSCSAPPDNESYETNSEFASSLSLNNDNFVSSNREKDVSSLRRNKFETVSETSSSHSSAATISTHKTQSRELNIQTPAASSSLSSSQSKTEDFSRSQIKSTIEAAIVKNTIVSRSNVPRYNDLFSEPPEDLGSSSSTPSLVDLMQQKPVNFFNDDIDDVYKHLAIAQSKRNEPPVAKERLNVNVKPYSTEPTLATPSTPATPATSEKLVPKQRTIAHTGVLVLPHHKVGDEKQTTGGTASSKSRTIKNLFDDDQDDEDFLSAFVKKQESLGNPKLLQDPAVFKKTPTKNHDKGDLFEEFSKKVSSDSANIIETRNSKEPPKSQTAKTQKSFVNLFDDKVDEDLDVIIQKPSNMHSSINALEKNSSIMEKDNKTDKRNLANIIKSTNIFDDDDDDDDDDFFKTLPSKKPSVTIRSYDKVEDVLKPLSTPDENAPTPTDTTKSDQIGNKENHKSSSSAVAHNTEHLKSHPNVDSVNEKPSVLEANTINVETSSGLSVDTYQRDNTKNPLSFSSSDVLPKKFKSFLDDPDDDLPENLQSTQASNSIRTVNLFDEEEQNEMNNSAINNKISANNSLEDAKENMHNPLIIVKEANKQNFQKPTEVMASKLEDLRSPNKIAKFTNIFEDEYEDDDDDFMQTLPPIPSTSGKQQKSQEQIHDSFPKQGEEKNEDIRPANKSDEYEKLTPMGRNPTIKSTDNILFNDDKQVTKNFQDEAEVKYENKRLTSEIMFANEEDTAESVDSLKTDQTKNDLFSNNETELEQNVEQPTILNVATKFTPENTDNKESFFNRTLKDVDPNAFVSVDQSEGISSSEQEKQQSKEINAIAATEKENTFSPQVAADESISIMPQNRINSSKDELNNESISKDNGKTQKYDLAASFLFDEPPDDDDNEFFDTLGKSSHQSASKYINFDLPPDLYAEPELSKVPVGETSSSIYAGLQLFDDVPPEDDEFGEVITQKPETTKRLNTVFYDDFDETLEALNECKQLASIPTHSILDNEPPPDMVNDMGGKLSKHNKNVVDSLKEDKDNGELLFANEKNIDVENKSELPVGDIGNHLSKNRPIAKLQLPKININVETLLPFSGVIPSRTKIEQNINNNLETDTKSLQINTKDENSKSLETNHILPNVNKNRVRAPLNRRPSSRKARQENYRKSLLDKEHISNDDNRQEDKNQSNSVLHEKSMKESDSQGDKIIEEKSRKIVKEDLTTQLSSTILKHTKDSANLISSHEEKLDPKLSDSVKNSMVFKEKDGEEGDEIRAVPPKTVNDNLLFLPNDSAKELHIASNTKPANLNKSASQSNSPEVNAFPHHITTAKFKTNQAKNSASVFTDSESDDDLFSTLSTPLTKTNEVTKIDKPNKAALAGKSIESRKTPMKAAQNSIFSDESDGDDDFLKSTTQSKIISKSKPKAAPQTKSIFSDTEDSDDGDLFGSKRKVTHKPAMNTTLSNAAESSKPSIKQTIADNPLADLL